ncbi:MAG: ParB N-terminal domain-containing protein [Candidatus Symbiothrix sp.]|jgi:ParB-like chromosome segregation protein Spo0J|nr:ParB N-terminal domain-containing protein [Candidatus Symbiothrix sp.]
MTEQEENRDKIEKLTGQLCRLIKKTKGSDAQIEALNYIRSLLHEVSPLKHHPVDFVAWEKTENIECNDYNPNHVAVPEMKLLITSIEEDGFTMPIVTNPEEESIRIVDGFHRRQSLLTSNKIRQSTGGRLPVTYIREQHRNRNDRMATTIRHNRARGAHDIDLMSNIVREMTEMGRSTEWIMRHVGMDRDEILRLKQFTGLASLFADKEFSKHN